MIPFSCDDMRCMLFGLDNCNTHICAQRYIYIYIYIYIDR